MKTLKLIIIGYMSFTILSCNRIKEDTKIVNNKLSGVYDIVSSTGYFRNGVVMEFQDSIIKSYQMIKGRDLVEYTLSYRINDNELTIINNNKEVSGVIRKLNSIDYVMVIDADEVVFKKR